MPRVHPVESPAAGTFDALDVAQHAARRTCLHWFGKPSGSENARRPHNPRVDPRRKRDGVVRQAQAARATVAHDRRQSARPAATRAEGAATGRLRRPLNRDSGRRWWPLLLRRRCDVRKNPRAGGADRAHSAGAGAGGARQDAEAPMTAAAAGRDDRLVALLLSAPSALARSPSAARCVTRRRARARGCGCGRSNP